MAYVDGFVLAVPNQNKSEYLRMAQLSAEIFKEYGALSVVECWGDDVPDGEQTSFPLAVKCEAEETVCFSWVFWPSKEIRDEGMAKCHNDERMKAMCEGAMPFDGKRLIYGGFEVILNA
ncbi:MULTISPECIES: DUF1428 domain-containing protein [Pseudoalteromonas]|uniref:RNA signal recognition particle n=1 Tax=Pseudoalteromonas luteoviolacea (strain 2ta16) TaxID=1353533 RepID=V4HS71_PSEL2|nr:MULTISPECIES: DUF1428 domain-containing protein [Pseudoalteromonas]ESP93680.1 hypothetical protein PL2TA16_02884 [Pseudoalteromonas luteoviolacea 2ta16]KZN41202.1 hypothetical protein N483_16455 [Pseudoalteromonas luteoviolacea NCIMB 1944]MCG7550069.1 DUF1428 domain-containing protein [Pseudoalteromonas sp. Of7M-16]